MIVAWKAALISPARAGGRWRKGTGSLLVPASSALPRLEETAETLDGLGRALHFLKEYPRAIEVTESAFAAYREEGRTVDAADRARWLAFLHGAINGNMAVAGGWMERAASLLEDAEECAGHGG